MAITEVRNGPCNNYGNLTIKEEDGKYFWSVEDYDGHDWREIPKYLYHAIMAWHNSPDNKDED